MTYQNLLEILQTLTLEQLKMNGFHFTDKTVDVLDPEHPYLSF